LRLCIFGLYGAIQMLLLLLLFKIFPINLLEAVSADLYIHPVAVTLVVVVVVVAAAAAGSVCVLKLFYC